MDNKCKAYLFRSTAVGALGGLLFGFDTAVIAGTTHSLMSTYSLTPELLGITVSIALWGTVISSMTAGIPGEKLGARDALRITAVLYIISALGCAFSPNWWILLGFRFLGGLGIGASSVLGPVYIAELAPPKWRGRLVGLFQINIVVGILVAYFSNYIIGLQHFGINEWRYELGVSALPAILFFCMLFGIPRSPRWLVAKGFTEEALAVLQMTGDPTPEAELQLIEESIGQEHKEKIEPLFQKKYLRPILLAASMGAFSQLSGINAILYYLNDIFAQAGFDKLSGDMQSVIIGATNLTFTLVAMAFIDRFGRKPLLLIGGIGMATSLFGIAAVMSGLLERQNLLVFLVLFIGFFAASQGAVIWVYMSEIFPTLVRARGQSLGSASHWIMNAIISGVFPVVAKASGAKPFIFFGLMMLVQFFIVIRWYPETKGVSLEELEQQLGTG
ncbi:MAG: sugar porter family MFS transporter [Candidatus Obscuribacterales bacterium]|nr:sugar porter family MFS transporter [Candidatus Obscuribacterales bacterium]